MPQFSFDGDMKLGLTDYESLQRVLDARATKKSDALIRRKILAHREKQTYQLEYDRIRDLMHSKTIRSDAKSMLEHRIKKPGIIRGEGSQYYNLILFVG